MRFPAAFAILVVLPETVAAQLPPREVLDRARQAVVRVQAAGCESGEARATGFALEGGKLIVTALHVVAGCRQITVYSETLGREAPATISRVLPQADLALLAVEPVTFPGVPVASTAPKLHEDVVAIGYALGTPTIGTTNLKISYGQSRLEQMLPGPVRDEIRRVGVPSLSLEILRLQGHLVPGLSGAPIINGAGQVVAVSDGGLESGAVSISWAVPSSNIRELLLRRNGIHQGACSILSAACRDGR
jgi:S1-C subfamily serine protease